MAALYNSASGCIVQLRNQEFNVVSTSASEGNFLERDSHWPLEANTFCRTVIETDEWLYCAHASADDNWCEADHVKKGPVRSYLGFPLHWPNKEIFGTLCVIDTRTSNYNDNMIELLGQLALLIEADLQHLHDLEEVTKLAITDELTGIYNRRGFLTLVPKFLHSAQLSKHNTAFIYLDIDNLKQVNDNFGHLQGDRLIASLGNIVKAQCSDDNVCARLGGDEFVICLQNVTEAEVKSILACIDHTFTKALSESLLVSNTSATQEFSGFGVSIGYHIFKADDNSDIDSRLSKTDALMYANKAQKKTAADKSYKIGVCH